jgi:hypothetical protein
MEKTTRWRSLWVCLLGGGLVFALIFGAPKVVLGIHALIQKAIQAQH